MPIAQAQWVPLGGAICIGLLIGLERERRDPGQDVAARRRAVDARLVDHDLREQVVDVGVRMLRTTDDRDLAGQWVRAADAVDLSVVG